MIRYKRIVNSLSYDFQREIDSKAGREKVQSEPKRLFGWEARIHSKIKEVISKGQRSWLKGAPTGQITDNEIWNIKKKSGCNWC